MAKHKVNAREFLADIRAGTDDAGLMHKYGLSSRQIISVVSKLIWQGLLPHDELARRRSLAKTVYMPIYKCSSCKEVAYTEFEQCPHCGALMKNLNERKPKFNL